MLGTITLTVEQTEPAKVTLNGEQEENMEVTPSDIILKENTKEDGQAEISEINATTPVSEEKVESPEQSNENQSSEVGFKKVFKFVGFKFTVRKDKTEKAEPVQLLTVKKDEAEVNGTTSQEEHIDVTTESKTQAEQETKDDVQQAESPDGAPQAVESPTELPEEVQKTDELPETQKKKEEPEVEKDKKSPESPTNTVVTETSSPFRRFFTQGWAGLRKRTSFKKSKEEDPEEVEKHIKGEEQEKIEVPEAVKEEGEAAKETAEEQPVVLEETSKSEIEELKSTCKEDSQISPEETKAEKETSDQAEDQKPEEAVTVDEGIEQVTEERERAPEIVTSSSSEVKAEIDTLEITHENQITGSLSPQSVEVTNESQAEVAPETEVPASNQSELHSSTESADVEKGQEVIATEAELLSSQEKVKAQGSPLKKLFSSSGLRKLSGKKSKGKKEDDAKADVTAETVPATSESPDAAEGDNGDSSPSSPDESAETSPTEKTVEGEPQAADLEGEGATSDGERKKDGITPWASFKKLVTPKRRPKRPSESDKEDEVEKVKTSTLSSTDSGGSVENQEEIKETSEEQKLEKSTEENKKKADSSVSWDALICVGSSKKRARKTSDSDEEEIQKSQEESKKIDGETVQTKEPEPESPITSSQEQEVQESPSPDQASSPTDGDGVSTWQSFKRLVTPRRKSKTKAEEKPEETAAVSNPEQSTSEGEGSKEESWVSFKKLIPGRKKKRSDAKQEQAPPSGDKPVQESTEDDSDEPAVVPLAEFDAAELEKLNAQKSVVVSAAANVSGEQKESPQKPSDELIHAVTVTLIEGERAVTSLEERAPSWISAKVTESIEHAKEVDETTKKIKTEITVEETVVFSTVSEVMSETQRNLINEVELTSEALTALEEAIETSCAEETTEMLSAVSQLGESVMSTEQATPVPEDDASMQTLKEQKQLTDNILHAVAESAKLSIDVINSENSTISPSFEDVVVEEHIEEVIIAVTERVTECIPNSLDEHVQVKSEEKVSESTVDELVPEKPIENVHGSAYDQDVETASISAEEKIDKSVSFTPLQKSGEDLQNSASVQVTETLDSGETKVVAEEQTTEFDNSTEDNSGVIILFADRLHDTPLSVNIQSEEPLSVSTELQAEVSVPVSSELEAKESSIPSKLQEEAISAADVKHVEEPAPISLELKSEDAEPVAENEGVLVDTNVKAEECAPVADEVETEEKIPEIQDEENNLVASDMRTEECAPVPLEVQAKEEDVLVEPEVKTEEAAPVQSETQAEESAPVSVEVQPEESETVPPELEAKEGSPVSPEFETQEGPTVLAEVKTKESDVPSEVQKEDVPVLTEVKAQESDAVSSEVQDEESAPVPHEVQVEEAAPVLSEVQAEEANLVSFEEQAEEAAPVSFKVQTEEASLPSEVQVEETALVPSKVQTKEETPVLVEVKAQESDAVSCEVQAEESIPVPSEVQVEEVVLLTSEVQAEETTPLSPEVQVEKAAPMPSEVQVEEVTLPSELHVKEDALVPSAVQAEEAAVPSEVEEAAPVLPEVKAEETTPTATEVGDATVKAEEDVHVLTEIQAEESFPVLSKSHVEVAPVPSEVQASVLTKTEEDTKVKDVAQAEEGIPMLTEVQTAQYTTMTMKVEVEECAAGLTEENVPNLTDQVEEGGLVSTEVAAEDVPLSAELKDQESVTVSKEDQGECASLSSEVNIEEAIPVLLEKQTEDFVVLTEPQVEKSIPACVEGQANETISLSDKIDFEECTPGLAKELTEEVILAEEQVKGEVLAAENVLVSAEKQDNECEAQAEENVSILGEVQTQLPVLAKELLEEGVATSFAENAEKDVSDKLQAQECISDVQKEDGEQIEECILEISMEKVITVVDDHLESTGTASEHLNVKYTQAQDEETKESGGINVEQHQDEDDSGLNDVVNQLSLLQKQVAEVKEEIITTDIPECETSEASNASEPVAAAAVEENMLAETVKSIETSPDCIEVIKEPELIIQLEDQAAKPEELQTLVASVSQKAAAIVDAAIEAAAICFVVDASCQVGTTEDTALTEENHQTEETSMETYHTKASSTTTEDLTIETTVETVTEKIIDNECVSTKRQSQEDEFASQVQEPEHESINVLSTSVQTKGNETDDKNKPSTQECVFIPSTDVVDYESTGTTLNVEVESKTSSINIQEDIHKTSVKTDSSTTNTQEKAQPVES
ncbi:A-kinase anchor protein 12 isoform 2-T2 [Mantella aurantiaca]